MDHPKIHLLFLPGGSSSTNQATWLWAAQPLPWSCKIQFFLALHTPQLQTRIILLKLVYPQECDGYDSSHGQPTSSFHSCSVELSLGYWPFANVCPRCSLTSALPPSPSPLKLTSYSDKSELFKSSMFMLYASCIWYTSFLLVIHRLLSNSRIPPINNRKNNVADK